MSDPSSGLFRLLNHYYREVTLDLEKILPDYKNILQIKQVESQREKTSLLQDLNLVLRGDKAVFRPVVEAAKKNSDSLKRRSVAYFIAKQLYYPSQSSVRLLKR